MMKKTLNFSVAAALIFIVTALVCELKEIPAASNLNNYAQTVLADNGSMNMVSAIYLDYRMYDTIFEITVFFIAAFGVSYILSKIPSTIEKTDGEINKAELVQNGTSVNLIFLLSTIFAIYIMITGHLGPGGGFVGGVIGGTGILVLSGNKDLNQIENDFEKMRIHGIEKYVLISIPIIGLTTLLFTSEALLNFLPVGTPGSLFSGGTAMILNFLIGFKVFAGTWTIFYHFVSHRGLI